MATYYYTYLGKENITVSEFIDPLSNRDLFTNSSITTEEFLEFDNGEETDNSNNARIYMMYDAAEKLEYEFEYNNFDLPYIKPGTDLLLPTNEIAIENITIYGDSQFLQQGDFNAYWSDNYKNLMENDGYVRAEKLTKGVTRTEVAIINENIRVYIWIAALNKIYDVTPYVYRVNTSKSFDVGTFTITLNPTLDINDFFDTGLDIINFYPMNKLGTGATIDFFEKFLQVNDLVFIRFETLLLEEEDEIVTERSLEISTNQLPGKVWDMIGLIDTVNTSMSVNTTDKVVQVGGRDLMKLLIDDASYFIPTVFRSGSDLSFIYGGNPEENFFKRNFISGAYDFYFAYSAKSIRDVLGFVINHLSNLQIVDDKLLDVYGDRISTVYDVTGANKNYLEEKQVRGIWKIIKLFVDPVVDDRRIADDAFANPDGSLLEYVNRICQKPFVQFYGDTNGDQFDFIVRQLPFTKKAIQNIVGSGTTIDTDLPVNESYLNINEIDVISYSLDWETRYYSWYQVQAQNVFMGNNDTTSLSVIPIIFLPKYVEKFGNKRLIVPNNYFSSRALKGDANDKSISISIFAEVILNDLKYLIDINSYLPFTRRGTITIQGDRRIKVGTFVRLACTDELFFVTNVSHSAQFSNNSIDRVTILTVERGMFFKYINGIDEPEGYPRLVAGTPGIQEKSLITSQKSYSYFNIVDTDLIINTIIRRLQGTGGATVERGISTNFGVNEDIFDFFVNRQQMVQ